MSKLIVKMYFFYGDNVKGMVMYSEKTSHCMAAVQLAMFCTFITLGYRISCKTKGVDCENVKVHHFLVPLTTVPVCADTSWWRRQALTCGYSYTNSLCRNMDETQKFSTVWESGSVPSSVEVNCCLLSSRWFSSFSSKSLMQSFRCSMCSSSADILWASDSQ